ncbi:hypothetical protein PV334_19735 [Streptomyces sp. ME02-7008A-1]|uniref:hypothetical protein n=1 Tax=unclassified Streptomyces TaxID=2593676 RepID=UPI0029BB86F7|nr:MULTISPECIES: hypothetical protein [unclassified Streptomyces]MDX3183479.1 hypothetical protein [Streptomyces sp. ME02-7008A-1]MDX3303931.1 hypothetical protein [Streptomyces sp. ME02-7008A]
MADDQEKAAYQRLEAAVEEVCRLEGYQGVLTEWVVIAASQRYDEDGDGITQVGTLLPSGGGAIPHHRVMGLLDYVQTRMRAVDRTDDGMTLTVVQHGPPDVPRSDGDPARLPPGMN